MKIAVIAPGAMGAGVAQRMRENGGEIATTLQGRSPASAKRAEGLIILESEQALAAWADVVLSILPPDKALELAQSLAPTLCPRGQSVIYADCNAISQDTMAKVAAALPGIGVVDIGIIGSPPKPDGSSPHLYASGDLAPKLAIIGQLGIDYRPMEGGIGAASALKMCYAVLSKGMVALASIAAVAATRTGAAPALQAEMQESLGPIVARLQKNVPEMFDKAYRWVGEMEEIAAFLGAGPGADTFMAIAALYQDIADIRAAPAPDDAVEQIRAFYATI